MRFPAKTWSTLALCFSMLATEAQEPTVGPPSRAKAIRNLQMRQLANPGLQTFYSAGAEARAAKLQQFIEQERSLYRERLGWHCQTDFAIAMAKFRWSDCRIIVLEQQIA